VAPQPARETKTGPEAPKPALKVVVVPKAEPRTGRDMLKDTQKEQTPMVAL